jgi:MYXO-CTERM domain-containing protein
MGTGGSTGSGGNASGGSTGTGGIVIITGAGGSGGSSGSGSSGCSCDASGGTLAGAPWLLTIGLAAFIARRRPRKGRQDGSGDGRTDETSAARA